VKPMYFTGNVWWVLLFDWGIRWFERQSTMQDWCVCVRVRKLSGRRAGKVSLWIKSKIGFDFSSLNFYWLHYLYVYILLMEIDCSVYSAFGTNARMDLIGYSPMIIYHFCINVLCVLCLSHYISLSHLGNYHTPNHNILVFYCRALCKSCITSIMC